MHYKVHLPSKCHLSVRGQYCPRTPLYVCQVLKFVGVCFRSSQVWNLT
jgi:hypothetical protein